jgi:hypothetical protein
MSTKSSQKKSTIGVFPKADVKIKTTGAGARTAIAISDRSEVKAAETIFTSTKKL